MLTMMKGYAMADISDSTVAILATIGFEQSELEPPLKALKEAGATVYVIAPEGRPDQRLRRQ